MFVTIFLTLAKSVIDSYSLSKELTDIQRYQHQTGGFMDAAHVPKGDATMQAIWLSNVFYLFPYFNHRTCFKWITTLKNRDGGAGLTPGAKSSIYGTYCFFQMARIIQPDLIESTKIVEFLRTLYDSQTGLFRNSLEEAPSIEATYYAYEFFGSLNELDLAWLNTIALRQQLTDHLVDTHFEFDGVKSFDAQLFGSSIAKFISFTVPYKSISEYITQLLSQGIDNGEEITYRDVYYAVKCLKMFDDEPIPEGVSRWLKPSTDLADIFYSVAVLVEMNQISDFFELDVKMANAEGQEIDFVNDGIDVQQIIKPQVRVIALGKFIIVNQFVNASIGIADEEPFSEQLQIDYQTGIYSTERLTTISKLGRLSFTVLSYEPNPIGSPIIVHREIYSHISIPVKITCEATFESEELPVGSYVQPGTSFHVLIECNYDSGVEIAENTAATFTVYDAAGVLLASQYNQLQKTLEYNWQLPSLALPPGTLKMHVDIGDSANGLHTQKEFKYKVKAEIAATDLKVPKELHLNDIIQVTMTPAVVSQGSNIPFRNQKFVEGDIVDAAGEPLYPPTVSESHRYEMIIKCGGINTKSIEGKVNVENDLLSVEFETTIEDSIDFATGFNLAFIFIGEDGVRVPLEGDVFISVDTEIECDGLKKIFDSDIHFGSKVEGVITIKDKATDRLLSCIYSYPVLVIKTNDGQSLMEKRLLPSGEGFKVNVVISAGLPAGQLQYEIMVRKGSELVSVGGQSTGAFTVNGKPTISAKVVENQKFLIIDYMFFYEGNSIPASALKCLLRKSDGQVIASVPVSEEDGLSRLSWDPEGVKGSVIVDLVRLDAQESDAPLKTITVNIEWSIMAFFSNLPFEGLSIIISLLVLCWSIKQRIALKGKRY